MIDSAPAAPDGVLLSGRELSLDLGGRRILDRVDIEVKQGEVVTVVGANGAGKTTLLRALLGFVPVDSGRVWRRPGLRIGYTPQRLEFGPNLPITVERFLRLGTRRGGRLTEALRETGMDGALDAPMSSLSGGEFNRVLLARALLREPDLLVLDEPLGSVDLAGQAALYDLIDRIRVARGCGVLLISHDLQLVMSRTDLVVCLNHHVCCSGRPHSVVNNPAFVALFGEELAASVALYSHRHDHEHGLAGEVITH